MNGPKQSPEWLPFVKAYRTMCVTPGPELRQLMEEIRGSGLAAQGYR
jgi:hypothetical protein